MELSKEQVQRIVDAVLTQIGLVRVESETGVPAVAWPTNPPMVQLPPEFYESQRRIAERVARLEERFEQVDKRFEQIDRRFEQIDKRFDDLIHYMDKRFEQVDKRFAAMQWTIGIGFTLITVVMSVYNFVG